MLYCADYTISIRTGKITRERFRAAQTMLSGIRLTKPIHLLPIIARQFLRNCALWAVLLTVVGWNSAPLVTTAYRQTALYLGPGHTYLQIGILNPGVPVQIVERNAVGNWVRIHRVTDTGQVVQDGWVMTGYMNYPPHFRLSAVPVNTQVADAEPANAQYRSTQQLYAVPVISTISPKMLGVYKYGQALGNQPAGVTKVGDSVSANPLYLNPMNRTDYELGPYDFLEETIRLFGPSLAVDSVAARIGMTTYVVFDPLWADKSLCLSNETPLACEYRLKKPSVSMIMFGPNDVRHMTDAEFAVQIRQIVDETLALGIIPVLSTFSVDPDDRLWWQAINFNLRLTEIAAEYEIPLINLWAAARVLPGYGLDQDRIHMANSGFPNLKFSSGHEAYYGTSLQNLLSIRMLDEIRLTLNIQ
jgi:hypothetical protein